MTLPRLRLKVSDVKNGSYDDKVALPNVVGKDVSEAKKTLETSGFTNVKVVDENGNSASSGKVESMTQWRRKSISVYGN